MNSMRWGMCCHMPLTTFREFNASLLSVVTMNKRILFVESSNLHDLPIRIERQREDGDSLAIFGNEVFVLNTNVLFLPYKHLSHTRDFGFIKQYMWCLKLTWMYHIWRYFKHYESFFNKCFLNRWSWALLDDSEPS